MIFSQCYRISCVKLIFTKSFLTLNLKTLEKKKKEKIFVIISSIRINFFLNIFEDFFNLTFYAKCEKITNVPEFTNDSVLQDITRYIYIIYNIYIYI